MKKLMMIIGVTFLIVSCSSADGPPYYGPVAPEGIGPFTLHYYFLDSRYEQLVLYTEMLGYTPLDAKPGQNCDDKERIFRNKGGVFEDSTTYLAGTTRGGLLLCLVNKHTPSYGQDACAKIGARKGGFNLYQ